MTVNVGDLIGQYRLLDLIGQGGVARVFRALQPGVDRIVAIKVLSEHGHSPSSLDRFTQEAQIIARLDHSNIVPVYDYGQHAGTPYLVMRYVQAPTLRQVLARLSVPLSLPEASHVMSQVAAGLEYAHSQNIIHRDIKPSNILIDRTGRAYLVDFGTAKVLEATLDLTRTGTFVGTATHIAPEQVRGHPVTATADVYALGIVLYEMLTGRPPFQGENEFAMAMQHVSAEVPPLSTHRPDLPPETEAVIQRALHKEPGLRQPSAGALAAELLVLAERAGPSRPTRLTQTCGAMANALRPDRVDQQDQALLHGMRQIERRRKLQRQFPGFVIAALFGVVAVMGWTLYSQAQFTAQSEARVTALIQTLTQVGPFQATIPALQTLAAEGRQEAVPTLEFLLAQLTAASTLATNPGLVTTSVAATATPVAPLPSPAIPSPTRTRTPIPLATRTPTLSQTIISPESTTPNSATATDLVPSPTPRPPTATPTIPTATPTAPTNTPVPSSDTPSATPASPSPTPTSPTPTPTPTNTPRFWASPVVSDTPDTPPTTFASAD